MLEINVDNITNQDNSKRAKWSVILGILTFVFGIPSALSYGVMADVHIFLWMANNQFQTLPFQSPSFNITW
ncbi:sodium-dependent transporter [Streptococcus pneumoniae]|nr:sodium-dependent transporter [Streptococcus pneumoniae]VLK12217.1 sodium-dependent transporter [Streptococcus pneumoniae]VMO04748.1 sodium-dependent transporter [Streptococcus pneumoniae]